MKKNVLIISYNFPPHNVPAAHRPYNLAKYLDKLKYNVTVISAYKPDYSNTNWGTPLAHVKHIHIPASKVVLTSQSEKLGAKSFGFGFSLKAKTKKLASQLVFPDKGRVWYPKVIAFLKKNTISLDTMDIVFTTSPLFSNHLIGRYVKTHFPKIKWVVDFRDFHYPLRKENQRFFRAAHKRAERSIVKQADVLVFVTQSMMSVYQDVYPEYSSKMTVIHNSVDVLLGKEMPVHNVENNNRILRFIYAGNFYAGQRSIEPFLKLLDQAVEKKLLSVSKIEIRIAGNVDAQLQKQWNSYTSAAAITYLGFISQDTLTNEYRDSDMTLLLVANKPSHYKTLPLKTFELLALQKPILCFAPAQAEAITLLSNEDAGWIFRTDDFIENQFTILEKLINDYRKNVVTKIISTENLSKYSSTNQAKRFEQLFDR